MRKVGNMYDYSNIDYSSINEICFKLDVFTLLNKVKRKIECVRMPFLELIRYLYAEIRKYSKSDELYLKYYGKGGCIASGKRYIFKSLMHLSEVMYIDEDIDILDRIETFLCDGRICERVLMKNENRIISKCEVYDEDLYKFLKLRDVEVIQRELFNELYSQVYDDILKKSMEEVEVFIRYGSFKVITVCDDVILNFFKDEDYNEEKLEFIKFYIDLYLATVENADFIGYQINGENLELLAVESSKEPLVLSMFENCIEPVVMLYLLRGYIELEGSR